MVAAGSLAALLSADQDAAQTPPAFRSGVDVVLLDVTVLDRDRRPVRGLTAGDFTVLVDGVPRMLAETTGGRAVVNNNDMEREVPALLDETSSFYRIGIDAGAPPTDGAYRPVWVRVDRPDVDVRTRRGLYAMTTKEREAAESGGRGASNSLASPFSKGDVPLDVTAVPFLEPGPGRRPTLAVVLNVHPGGCG
jgi:hypothetical protein